MTIIQTQGVSAGPSSPSHSIGSDPHVLSQPEGSVQPEYDHPILSTPSITATTHQLLQIADQFIVESLASVNELYFPWRIGVYDPNYSTNEEKWNSCAHVNGRPLGASPNAYYTANGGLTKRDRIDIHQDLKLGEQLENIWE
jgi:hypothetical protein